MRIAPIVSTAALALALAGCATRSSGGDEIVLTGTNAGAGDAAAYEALPPPPAPPPPPVYAADANSGIVVTGQARAEPNLQSAPVTVTGQRAVRDRRAERGFKLAAPSSAYVPSVIVPADPGNERYDGKTVSPVHLVASDPVSTFSVDVDTGAYANSRRFLSQGQMPPADAVRSEELVNYFRYDYPLPATRETPIRVTTDVAATPWNPATRLLRIGLRGYDLPRSARPPANLVFLVDV